MDVSSARHFGHFFSPSLVPVADACSGSFDQHQRWTFVWPFFEVKFSVEVIRFRSAGNSLCELRLLALRQQAFRREANIASAAFRRLCSVVRNSQGLALSIR
jgi:hypothetical protein